MTIPKFQNAILEWYQKNKRQMPWRNTRDPYKILVSEIMLHQTQVSRVLPKYAEFLNAFPTIQALAQSSDKKLLKIWKGLGYWRRAKNLKKTAQVIIKEHKGEFPKDAKSLQTLPGVGPYTAGALACFAWNQAVPFIDTNIRRVYTHFFFSDKESVSDKEIEALARKAIWKESPREWHYALFDYGALVLKDKSVNKKSKHYAKQSPFKGSFRSFRTRVIRWLLERGEAPVTETHDFLEDALRKEEADWNPEQVLRALERDGLIKKKSGFYTL